MKLRGITAAVLVSFCLPALAQPDGEALYSQHCAQCHDSDNNSIRAPHRSMMRSMTFEAVLGAITSGSMASMVEGRTRDERAAIAAFVTGKAAGLPAATAAGAGCVENAAAFLHSPDAPRWNGWGVDVSNSRFQPAAMAGLTAELVPRLKLKWAFGFPGGGAPAGQPTIVGGLVFVGGSDRKVYALDARSGCTRWTFATNLPLRTAISVGPSVGAGPPVAYFGDLAANAYAVNAATGVLIWKTRVEDHPAARITGAPTLHAGVLFVPVSSIEEATGSSATYQCCTFRGSVVALDAATGKQIWKSHTIPEAPAATTRNAMGTQLYGPAGAAVFSAPTIDVQRQALYVATGNSYSNPPAETSDAVIAFDLAAGCFGIDRPPRRTASLYPASAPAGPTVRRTTVRITTLPNRRSWWTCTMDSVRW